MQAGQLREIISIEKLTETRSTVNGEQSMAWTRIWRGRAKVDFSSGTQMVENNETINTVTRKVTIRTKPVLAYKLADLRVKIGPDYYRILSRDVRNWDMATVMQVELINV